MQLSAEGVEALTSVATADVASGVLPSCQYAIAHEGQVLLSGTIGAAPADARFSIWSSTKPVFASVVWHLMGEGLLRAEDRVVDLWPEFGAHGKDAVTVEHLLVFTAGFPEGALDLRTIDDRDARRRQMEQWTLDWVPGTQFGYHGLSAHWVLAELVEIITGMGHAQALRERVLDPLGLDRLELGVDPGRSGDVEPLVVGGEPATPQEFADALGIASLPPEMMSIVEAGLASGASPDADLMSYRQPHVMQVGLPGGGAVSDAASLALFYQAVLHNPGHLWDPSVLQDATSNVRNTLPGGPLGALANRTLGLEVQGDDATARFRSGSGAASPRTFGHGGALGQVAWADPDSGVSFAYLTNGFDLNTVRQARRGRLLSEAVVACLESRQDARAALT